MHIWVDADACPRPIKEILFKAAERREVETTLIANQYLHTPPCRFINAIVVAQGFDVADNEIVKRMSMGDLVVTQDIPLADEVVAKGGVALNPRGTLYTEANIKDHLSRRDMMEQLRDSGMVSGGPSSFDKKDIQAFSNSLDRELTRARKSDP
ncbi:MAG: YaiI/YqxD family protein [Pseudomonadota bacterium]|nr:YaiI/YqxD family protein [Pseudomonadota bacterium]